RGERNQRAKGLAFDLVGKSDGCLTPVAVCQFYGLPERERPVGRRSSLGSGIGLGRDHHAQGSDVASNNAASEIREVVGLPVAVSRVGNGARPVALAAAEQQCRSREIACWLWKYDLIDL